MFFHNTCIIVTMHACLRYVTDDIESLTFRVITNFHSKQKPLVISYDLGYYRSHHFQDIVLQNQKLHYLNLTFYKLTNFVVKVIMRYFLVKNYVILSSAALSQSMYVTENRRQITTLHTIYKCNIWL